MAQSASTSTGGFFAAVEVWFKANVLPFFTTVVESEVTALAPIATQAVESLETGEIAALAAGGKTTGNVLAKVVANTAAAAETASIQVGASSLLAAVGNAVAVKTAPPTT